MADFAVQPPTSAPPETILSPENRDAVRGLGLALELDDPDARRVAVSRAVAQWPQCLDAWAALAEEARDPVEAYAASRVGYHRGLDRLRQSGWKGSGYVRWSHEENRGFLRCVATLRTSAAAIGEADEVERLDTFLRQLDPAWPPPSTDR